MQVVKGRVMPRPCQKRRARVAAQKGASVKPVQPPPLPKSKPSARGKPQRGRGRGRGGRGGNFGGRPTRGQNSQMGGAEEFRSFVEAQRSGNQFGALNNKARAGSGRPLDPFVLDDSDSDLEEGELTDDGSDMDDSMSDLDTDDSEGDMMINLGEVRPQKGRPIRAQVMFTALEAASVYNNMHQAGFPLSARRMGRFDARGELVEVEIQAVYTNGQNMSQSSHMHSTKGSNVPVQTRSAGDRSTRSSAYVSDFPRGQQAAADKAQKAQAPAPPRLPEHDFVRDYVFDWGRYKNSHISDVPESYLRTIGGQSFVFDGRHPGLKEAFDHHRPELRRAAVDVQPPAQAPVQAPRRTRSSVSSFEKFRFPKGAAKGKRLDEVDENYLKTLEGMPTIVHSWPGLKEALADFNEKTGRQGRVFPEHVESRLP